MKKTVYVVLCQFLLFGCAATIQERRLSSTPKFTEIVQGTSGDLLLTWQEALEHCKSRNSHLPTAREYANLLRPLGTKILEASEVTGTPPAGYYLVDCKNPDGSLDKFYMNHSGYKRPEGETVNHLLWTSSIPPQHPEFAHVYYDEWGGGGGNPMDHKHSHPNAFQCVSDE